MQILTVVQVAGPLLRKMIWLVVLFTGVGCAPPATNSIDRVDAAPDGTRLVVTTNSPVGRMVLWAPEGVMSNTGACAIYPVGQWERVDDGWRQHIEPATAFGSGNARVIDDQTMELAGIRFPKDQPVAWTTTVKVGRSAVALELCVTNRGSKPIERAGAAICLKFLDGAWWSDDATYAWSGGKLCTLSELGRTAGPDNGFEAWPLVGKEFDNLFYHQFWGISSRRLDAPVMISEHKAGRTCVMIQGSDAYFLHSNLGNPCTDIMLALGTIAPGQSATATCAVSVLPGIGIETFRGMTVPAAGGERKTP